LVYYKFIYVLYIIKIILFTLSFADFFPSRLYVFIKNIINLNCFFLSCGLTHGNVRPCLEVDAQRTVQI